MHKRKEVVQDVTLHDLDVANAKPKGGSCFVRMAMALWSGRTMDFIRCSPFMYTPSTRVLCLSIVHCFTVLNQYIQGH